MLLSRGLAVLHAAPGIFFFASHSGLIPISSRCPEHLLNSVTGPRPSHTTIILLSSLGKENHLQNLSQCQKRRGRKDLNQKGNAKQSVKVDEILASGEVRQEPGLPAKDQSHLKPQSENSRASNVHRGDATQPVRNVHQRRMRTVSRDGCLNERGVNLQTGSPRPATV